MSRFYHSATPSICARRIFRLWRLSDEMSKFLSISITEISTKIAVHSTMTSGDPNTTSVFLRLGRFDGKVHGAALDSPTRM